MGANNGAGVETTAELEAIIEERSAPDPERPRLSQELEDRLAPLDRRSAACYADAERLTHKLKKARAAIERANAENDGVPIDELDDVDSLVASASNLKLATRVD